MSDSLPRYRSPVRFVRTTALLLALLLALLTQVGRAQAQTAAPPREIDFYVDDQEQLVVVDLYCAAIASQLPDATVRSHHGSPLPGGGSSLVFSLKTSDRLSWQLRLTHEGRHFERRLLGEGRDPAALEATAQVAAQATLVLLSTNDSSDSTSPELSEWSEQPAAEPVARPPAAPLPSEAKSDDPPNEQLKAPRKRKRARSKKKSLLAARGIAAYRAQLYAQQTWSHGAALSLELGSPAGWFGALGYFVTPRLTIDSDFGSFTLRRSPIDLQMGYLFDWDDWRLSPLAGFALEPSRTRPVETPDGVGEADPVRQFSYGVSGMLRAAWAPVHWASFQVGVGLSLMLRRSEFLAAGVEEPIFTSARARPWVDLGLVFPLFGADSAHAR